MLSQELDSDVHQFQCVQCASSCFRSGSCMGSLSCEAVADGVICKHRSRRHHIYGAWVPA